MSVRNDPVPFGWVITPPPNYSLSSSKRATTHYPPYSKIEQFRESETGERVLCFRGRAAKPEDVVYIRRLLAGERPGRKTSKLTIMFCNLTDELLELLFLARSDTQASVSTGESSTMREGFTDALVNIHEIQMGSNAICEHGARSLQSAIWATNWNILTKLNLSSNQLGCKGAIAVAQIIRDCPGLTYLDLSANGIQDEGMRALGKAVAKSKSLQILHLEANLIRDRGLAELTEGVQNSPYMQVLNLAYNVRLSNFSYYALQEGIKTHLTMREVSLEGTEISVYYRMLLRKHLLGLHSERAKVLTTLLSPRYVKRLNRNCNSKNATGIAMLPAELIRMVDAALYDPRTGTTVQPRLKPNALTLDNLTMFIILQVLLCFWAFLGAVMANWI